jgi:hypothetical protein
MVFTVKSNTHMMKNALMIGHGQREARDHGGSPRVEEQVDDHHREHRAEHDRQLHVGEGLADAPRVVADDRHLDVARQLVPELGHRGAHGIGHCTVLAPEILSTSSETADALPL